MIVKEIQTQSEKSSIATTILRDLPEWFGIEEATKEYIDKSSEYPMFASFIQRKPVAFYSLRKENDDVLDMYVLGVLKQYHHQGIGRALQEAVNQYAKEEGYSFLMVLTLAAKSDNKEYALTRKFYHKMGFVDFYQNDAIFDQNNPCQILIKKL